MPRVQYAEANFAIVIQVWIEAYCLIAGCLQVDHGRRVRVVGGKENVKLKTAIGVRSVLGTRY